MSSSGFHIAECTVDDLEEMVVAFKFAFEQEKVHQFIFQLTNSDSKHAWLMARFRDCLVYPDPGTKHFKAVDTASGKLASFGRWIFPHPTPKPQTEEEKAEKERSANQENRPAFPEGGNAAVFEDVFSSLDKAQKKWVIDEEMYVMAQLATHPDFQRRGCASMVLTHVLDMADREGRKAYLKATRPGKPLYEKLGFKTVELMDFNSLAEEDEKAGRTTEEDRIGLHWAMIREPQPPKPEFHIAECTLDDLTAMVDAYQSAFGREQVHQYIFPEATCPREKSDPWLMAKFGKRLRAPAPGVKHFKTVHTASGKLASWGRWVFPHPAPNPQTEEEKAEEERRDKAENRPDLPEGANVKACEEFFGALDKSQKKWVVDEEMYVMGLLATHPDFQRRGCASKLLKYVLNMADKEGRKAYIEATKPGKPVYERLGWKTVEVLTFKSLDELDRKAGRTKEEDRVGIHWVMMRDPQPLRA